MISEVVIGEIQEYALLVEPRFYADGGRMIRDTKSRVTEQVLAAVERPGNRIARPRRVVRVLRGGSAGL